MKKLSFHFIAVVSLFLLFSSCQKEVSYNTDNNYNPVTGDFRAKIDGTQWVANKLAVATRELGIINITGLSNDDKTITITLEDLGVGTYQLAFASTQHAGVYADPGSGNPIAFTSNAGTNSSESGGSLTITEINTSTKRMSGTFSFKALRQSDGATRNITEGVFNNISFAPPPAPPSSNKDTFKVKISGSEWIPPTIMGVKSPAVPPLPSQITVTGSNTSTMKSVALVMPADITPGTYTLDFFGATYIGVYTPDADPSRSQASSSGTLTILSHNTTTKRIRGNFNFQAEALLNPLLSTQLTEGFFAITYQ